MSWSINAKGNKEDVLQAVSKQLENVKAYIKDKELEVAVAIAGATTNAIQSSNAEKYEFSVALYGSASFNSDGKQEGQAFGANVSFSWKQ